MRGVGLRNSYHAPYLSAPTVRITMERNVFFSTEQNTKSLKTTQPRIINVNTLGLAVFDFLALDQGIQCSCPSRHMIHGVILVPIRRCTGTKRIAAGLARSDWH